MKFTDRNWKIVAELERVAGELGTAWHRFAIIWTANRPGVGSVILGATKLSQLEDNLGALDFDIPAELRSRLDDVSALPARFPYTFFTPGMQAMLTGGAIVGDKPAGYTPPQLIDCAACWCDEGIGSLTERKQTQRREKDFKMRGTKFSVFSVFSCSIISQFLKSVAA